MGGCVDYGVGNVSGFDPTVCGFCEFQYPHDPFACRGCRPVNGCGTVAAFPFYYIFTLIVTYVLLNVFIAVLLDAFEDAENEEESKLPPNELRKFCADWAKYDHENEQQMTIPNLNHMLKQLDGDMGFGTLKH